VEIKRTIKLKPEFCADKKPMHKKKRIPRNKIRQTAYVSDLQGQGGYVQEDHSVRSDS
jgi:hypothetical protein